MKEYVVNGKGYRVEPEDLDEFLEKYPDAVEMAGKQKDSPKKNKAEESVSTGSDLEGGSLESQEEASNLEQLKNIFTKLVL